MKMSTRVGKHSMVYTVANVFQKGVSFLLLPLYTRCLTPDDYGALAIVTAINSVLVVTFTLCLNAAFTRYYFEYQETPARLKEFWGTILTFILVLSVAGGAIVLAVGQVVLKPLLGDIPFWPLAALGILGAVFQPVTLIFLNALQTLEQSKRYAFFSLAQFAVNLLLTLVLVVRWRWGAEGPLTASLVAAVVFAPIYLGLLRRELTYSLKKAHVVTGLKYALPLVPHALAAQVQGTADRFFLNHQINMSSAGLYNIGSLVASVIAIMTESVNRAYVPASMGALSSRDPDKIEEVRALGMGLVAFYCLLAAGVSMFADEILAVFVSPAFRESRVVIPYLSFGMVFGGVYYLFVNVLFYDTRLTRFVVWGTATGVASSVVLNMILIPPFRLRGAAVASLLSQCLTTIVVGRLGRRHDPVRWDHARLSTCIVGSFLATVWVVEGNAFVGLWGTAAKGALFLGLAALVGKLMWGSATQLPRWAWRHLRGAGGARGA